MDGRDLWVEIRRGQGGLLALMAEANNPAQERMHGTGSLARETVSSLARILQVPELVSQTAGMAPFRKLKTTSVFRRRTIVW